MRRCLYVLGARMCRCLYVLGLRCRVLIYLRCHYVFDTHMCLVIILFS